VTVPDAPSPPLYLLADSQLLFSKLQGRMLLDTALRGRSHAAETAAAYVGASNGDRDEFYEIFESAMDAVGITDRRMIRSAFGPHDRAFLERARLIVLAGGDVLGGWRTFEKTGMKDAILHGYARGAVLVGISAGAVQLGRYAPVISEAPHSPELVEMFGLVPMVVDAHDEQSGWARLSRTVHTLQGAAIGLGIPAGGGVVVHPAGGARPLRRPAHEFRFDGSRVTHRKLRADDVN
jgi:cyanophycinase